MAVNTAYVASSELLERVAHRYRFDWLLATNRRASLYRIHLLNAFMYTGIILLTRGLAGDPGRDVRRSASSRASASTSAAC